MVMRLMDFAPVPRSSIGFDRLFGLNANSAAFYPSTSHPPHNIEKTGRDAYRVSLAVAGFAPDELEITTQSNQLVVTGKARNRQAEYLYEGISGRGFERRFGLAEQVEVTGATLRNGLLAIDLARKVPEAAKPRRIAVQNGTSPIETRAAA
jgi:molecular chaperone IbpA